MELWCFFLKVRHHFGGSLIEIWWLFGGILVAFWWHFGGSLVAVLGSPFTCNCKPQNWHQTATKMPPNFHQNDFKMTSILQKSGTTSTEKSWDNP